MAEKSKLIKEIIGGAITLITLVLIMVYFYQILVVSTI